MVADGLHSTDSDSDERRQAKLEYSRKINEADNALNQLATRLNSRAEAILWYRCWSLLRIIPRKEAIHVAVRGIHILRSHMVAPTANTLQPYTQINLQTFDSIRGSLYAAGPKTSSSPRSRILRKIAFWLGVVASLCGIGAFVVLLLPKGDYKQQALEHNPRLKFVGTPTITRLELDSLSFNWTGTMAHRGDSADPLEAKIKLRLTVRSTVKIANQSRDDLARIIGLMCVDTIGNVADFILGKPVPFRVNYDLQPWPRLSNSQIPPGDTVPFEATTYVRYMPDNRCLLHFILIYENELGHLYHTHATMPFEITGLGLRVEQETKLSELEPMFRRKIDSLIQTKELLAPLSPLSDFYTYEEDDADRAREHLDSLINTAKPERS